MRYHAAFLFGAPCWQEDNAKPDNCGVTWAKSDFDAAAASLPGLDDPNADLALVRYSVEPFQWIMTSPRLIRSVSGFRGSLCR